MPPGDVDAVPDPHPTLRDPELDRRLATEGFVATPFLDAEDVELLREGHERLVPHLAAEGGMAFDYMQESRSAMEAITALLSPVWERRLPQLFADHEVIFSTFVLKRPGTESGMYLHDDRSFVDERHHRSFALWVALDDTGPDLDNGCLYLVPGSHRISAAASGSNTPEWFTAYQGYFRRFLVPVPARAGDAVVYDSKTLHCSPPNRTDHVRRAVASAIAPRGAPLRWTFADGDRRRVHAIDRRFFVEHHPHRVEREGMPPTYPVVEEYVEHHACPSPEEIAAACDPADVPAPSDDPPALFTEPPPDPAPQADLAPHEASRAAPSRVVPRVRRAAGNLKRLLLPSR